ncbi:MAG: hypothetical protein U1E32_07275 [Rhodoglobus sp.]|nr:hypothetical protein [Rhodoglobus sp.]
MSSVDRNARRAADAVESTDQRMANLVDAMETQLELAKAAQASADAAQRFSRWISISSLIVSVASLGAAVAAIVVTLQ